MYFQGGKVVEGLSGKVLKPSKLDILATAEDSPPPPELKPTVSAAVSAEDSKDEQNDLGQTNNGTSDIIQG